MLVDACAWGAAICLTIYPAAAVTRIIRRKSSADYSLPALCIVVAGLAMYEVTIWESPGRWTGLVSLTWNCLMLGVVCWFRQPRHWCDNCGRIGTKWVRYDVPHENSYWLCPRCGSG